MENSQSAPKIVLERQLSIETEPKTLFDFDMNAAREAALEVIKKHTEEEALRIFLEGLMPVKIAENKERELALDVDEGCDSN